MKINDHISTDTKREMYKKTKKRRRRNKEKLSFNDIERLMGKYMDTYERRGGSIRKK